MESLAALRVGSSARAELPFESWSLACSRVLGSRAAQNEPRRAAESRWALRDRPRERGAPVLKATLSDASEPYRTAPEQKPSPHFVRVNRAIENWELPKRPGPVP